MAARENLPENPQLDAPALADVIASYLESVDSGRPHSHSDIADSHPELWEQFLRFLQHSAAAEALANTDSDPANSSTPHGVSRAPEGSSYGNYRVLRTLGAGGMGVVYVAADPHSGQLVAVKVLRHTADQHRSSSERFRREIHAVASLKHDHIVPLVASGIETETTYLAMQLIDGVPLTEVIACCKARLNSPNAETEITEDTIALTPVTATTPGQCFDHLTGNGDDFTGIALLIATIADALHVAHRSGIVHRDVKPSNILLDANGKAWLTDFGLAGFAEEHTALTATNEIIGTPTYMSPEQATASGNSLDPRSDVYSLGATLYELATLQRPFAGNRHQILFSVMQGSVAAPRAIRADIPTDLEAIIVKAMALSPQSRYPSPAEMAEDLRRFASGNLVQAKMPGWSARAHRWIERNPLVALVSLLGIIATIVAAFAVQAVNSRTLLTVNRKLESTNQSLSDSNKSLTAREKQLQQQLFVSDMSLAFKAYEELNTPIVRQVLDQHRVESHDQDRHGIAWHLLDGLTQTSEAIELTKHSGAATELAILPDNQTAISVGHDGQVHRFDLRDQPQVQVIAIGGELDAVAISPDGESLFTGMNIPLGLNLTQRYGIPSGDLLTQWMSLRNCVESTAVSPDGALFASADRYNEVQVRSADGTIVDQFITNSRNESLAFFNGNDQIAAIFRDSSGNDSLKLRDLNTKQTTELTFAFDPKTFACSAPRSTDTMLSFVVAGTDKIEVLQWPGEKRLLDEQRVVGRIRCVDISSDGETVVAGCDEGTILVWRKSEGDFNPTPRVIYASEQRINSVKCVSELESKHLGKSAKSGGILTACENGRVQLWPLPPDNPRSLLDSSTSSPANHGTSSWSARHDADSFFIRFEDGSIGVLDSSLNLNRIPGLPIDKLGKLISADDGEHVIVATPAELVRIEVQTGKTKNRVDKPDPNQSCTDMLVIADKLFVLFDDHLIVCNATNLDQLSHHPLPDDHANRLVQVPHEDKVDVVTRAHIHQLEQGHLSTIATAPTVAENYVSLTFSDSGDLYAIAMMNGTVRVGTVRVESDDKASPPIVLRGHRKEILACVFMDNDRTLATTSLDGTLRFWNLATGRELGSLAVPNPKSPATALHYFRESATLVTMHIKDGVQLWTTSPLD